MGDSAWIKTWIGGGLSVDKDLDRWGDPARTKTWIGGGLRMDKDLGRGLSVD